ncbi:unnamed protein product [Caenorhabditis auriculariae]|uniref:C-type lectin domain-containing protein n=1 Tax=Caenorhabditis auriculariae TaxID=2777116 RepID=A0A8S1HE89_9PELO|nr:unnamed protein product [Caenorhabditis auriculariae]
MGELAFQPKMATPSSSGLFLLLFVLIVFADAANSRKADVSGKIFCKSHEGKWEPNSDKSDVDSCNDMKLNVETGNEKKAKEACEYLVPFSVHDSKEGFPTMCSFNVESTCKDGWHQIHGRCFRMYQTGKTFDEAKKLCKKQRGSKLAVIDSVRTHRFLISVFTNLYSVWVSTTEGYVRTTQKAQGNFKNSTSYQLLVGAAVWKGVAPGSLYPEDPKRKAHVICQLPVMNTVAIQNFVNDRRSLLKLDGYVGTETNPYLFLSQNHYRYQPTANGGTSGQAFHQHCQKITSSFLGFAADGAFSPKSQDNLKYFLKKENIYYVLLAAKKRTSIRARENYDSRGVCGYFSQSDQGCHSFIEYDGNETLISFRLADLRINCADQTAIVGTSQSEKAYSVSRHVRAQIPCATLFDHPTASASGSARGSASRSSSITDESCDSQTISFLFYRDYDDEEMCISLDDDEEKNHYEALNVCIERDGHLAIFRSEKEMKEIYNFLKSKGVTGRIHIDTTFNFDVWLENNYDQDDDDDDEVAKDADSDDDDDETDMWDDDSLWPDGSMEYSDHDFRFPVLNMDQRYFASIGQKPKRPFLCMIPV